MIYLTRLNNQPFVLNADLIKFIENAPDTVVTLLTGEKLVVRESVEEVIQKIGEFHARFYRRAGPGIAFDGTLPGELGRVEAGSVATASKPPSKTTS